MNIVGSGAVSIHGGFEDSLAILYELGFHEFDILMISGWAHIGLDELAAAYDATAQRIERALATYNMEIASVNGKTSVKIEDPDSLSVAQRQRELTALKRFMKDFGIRTASLQPTLTGDSAYLRSSFDAVVARSAEDQQMFAADGLALSLEPHINSAVCCPEEIRETLKRYPDFRFVYDPSHILWQGHSIEAADILVPNTGMVHLRDAAPGEIFTLHGKGTLNLTHALRRLQGFGYSGPVAVEYLIDRRDELVLEDMMRFVRDVKLVLAG